MTKDEILAEIRRTAKENGGKPLGAARFEQVTGITTYDWLRHWPRFGDAQREAGFEPNKLNAAFSDEYLLKKAVDLTRELGKFPTYREMRTKRFNDPHFPDAKVFDRFGTRAQILARVAAFARDDEKSNDVFHLLEPLLARAQVQQTEEQASDATKYGFVYLVKGHPGEYKVGRTNLVDRRLSELGAVASVRQELVHEIKTDDPAGVEAYWHSRFAHKRMRGEWFKLNAADVKAFKRWRKIY